MKARSFAEFNVVTRLQVAIAALLVVAIAATGLAVWTSQRSAWLMDRLNLAHQVYEGYLALSSNAYQLFKQYGDALTIGDRDRGSGDRDLIAAVNGDIARLRGLIAAEIGMVGMEESGELRLLAEIEGKMVRLVDQLEVYRLGNAEDEFVANWSALSRILDGEIDRDFRALIDRALAEEAGEIAEVRAEIERSQRVNSLFAIAASVVAVAAAFGAAVMVDRLIRRPARQVIDGAARFGAGDFAHRIALEGSHELGRIAQSLDAMAARIEDHTRTILDQRSELERKVAERTAQLESMLEHAREADRNRRTLLSDVSHELKTPLTIIRGEADIALRGSGADTDTLRVALQRTREAATHTARIVDDLLFIARTEEGKPRLEPQRVDIADLLRAVLRTFAPEAMLLGADEPLIASVDPVRVRQAVLILCDNARRHGGTALTVRLDRMPDGCRIAVEDDGPGLSDGDKARAFERFYRGASAMSPEAGLGLGLGLPVALAIAEAHGGTIALLDRSGGGLIAALTLPASPRLRVVS